MKNIIIILFLLASTLCNCCTQAISDDDQAKIMLKEFFGARSTIKFTIKDQDKINSLYKQYCSKKLQKRLNELHLQFGLEHDFLTNDFGIDSLGLKTLTIEKDQRSNNEFIISYNIVADLVPNVVKKEINATIYMIVIKEEGQYKIDDIK